MDEREALARVRDKLRSGEISAEQFNMEEAYSSSHCNTVACIGGWMYVELQRRSKDWIRLCIFGEERSGFRQLFFPNVSQKLWRSITPAQAAQAIDNFLATNDPNWSKILESDNA